MVKSATNGRTLGWSDDARRENVLSHSSHFRLAPGPRGTPAPWLNFGVSLVGLEFEIPTCSLEWSCQSVSAQGKVAETPPRIFMVVTSTEYSRNVSQKYFSCSTFISSVE